MLFQHSNKRHSVNSNYVHFLKFYFTYITLSLDMTAVYLKLCRYFYKTNFYALKALSVG